MRAAASQATTPTLGVAGQWADGGRTAAAVECTTRASSPSGSPPGGASGGLPPPARGRFLMIALGSGRWRPEGFATQTTGMCRGTPCLVSSGDDFGCEGDRPSGDGGSQPQTVGWYLNWTSDACITGLPLVMFTCTTSIGASRLSRREAWEKGGGPVISGLRAGSGQSESWARVARRGALGRWAPSRAATPTSCRFGTCPVG